MKPHDDALDIDTTRAPLGEGTATKLVDAVAAKGDLAERHYLELKGPPSLSSKADKTKVAKFILGAANRMPDRAAEAFEGYGVMIIGITTEGVRGVPPVEMLALTQVIDPILGARGPHWDIMRVAVEGSDNQVIVVVVDPPQWGDPPFVCRKNGEGIQDGRIYYRADGETREVTSDEYDLLIERGATRSLAPVELEVSVLGPATTVVNKDMELLDAFINRIRARLFAALPEPEPDSPHKPEPVQGSLHTATNFHEAVPRMMSSPVLSQSLQTHILGSDKPEQRSEREYREEIERWENEMREAWPEALVNCTAFFLEPNEIRVVNKTRTYLEDVQIKLHLQGKVEAIERKSGTPRPHRLGFPQPPRKWGPTGSDQGFPAAYTSQLASSIPVSSFTRPDATWKNTGSVDIDIVVGDLRPEAHFTTSDSSSILIIRDEDPGFIAGTWSATARGYHDVFTGNLTVNVANRTDCANCIRDALEL